MTGDQLPIRHQPAAASAGIVANDALATEHRRESKPPVLEMAFLAGMVVLVLALGWVVYSQRQPATPDSVDAAGKPPPTLGSPIICDDVEDVDRARLLDGFELVPRTAAGRQLYDQLIEHDICTGVEYLEYNSGYARPQKSWRGDWSGSVIVIDQATLRYLPSDVLAATLVHEAKHIDRAISGELCDFLDRCEVLDNGVRVEEEVAAHAAEAQWWLEIYGPTGRRVASGAGYQMDNLVFAYQRGADAFRDFVIGIRDDSREGSGI